MYSLASAPIEDTDQTVHVHSLIRVFYRSSMGSQESHVSSGRKLRLWSDCVDTQFDVRTYHFVTYAGYRLE